VLLELEHTREEQLRLKDHFLSLVSHELRTPLNNLCLSVSNVAEGMVGDVSPEQRDVLGLALRSADQLTRMIGDILDLARADTGSLSVERKPTDIAAVLRDTLRTMELAARRKRLIVTLDLPEDLPLACADATRLRQIIANLIDNAVKFTPAGGAIRVAAERSTQAPELCISIADTGTGISAAGLRRVFDRFYQEGTPSDEIQRPGLGLGLYICRRLVQLLGGQISVDSRPGAGSVFRFTLPECTEPAREQQCTSPGAAVDAAGEAHRSLGHIGGVVP
jgi:signal transduction histidine kinase